MNDDQDDKAAILARRNRLVKAAMLSMASASVAIACGSDVEPAPQPCLDIAVDSGADAAPQPCLSPVAPDAAADGAPQPCLSAPIDAGDAAPQPCLDIAISDGGDGG